jgi:hypothetical protein
MRERKSIRDKADLPFCADLKGTSFQAVKRLPELRYAISYHNKAPPEKTKLRRGCARGMAGKISSAGTFYGTRFIDERGWE